MKYKLVDVLETVIPIMTRFDLEVISKPDFTQCNI